MAIAIKARKMPKTINAFTARTHLGRLIKLASEKGETFVVTKKGTPKAVLLGVKEYEDLLEIIAEEHDAEFRQALQESASQIQRGKVSSLEALRVIYKGR